jgi:hypothetical protein
VPEVAFLGRAAPKQIETLSAAIAVKKSKFPLGTIGIYY